MRDAGTRPGRWSWPIFCRWATSDRAGAVVKDPDRQVQDRLAYVFELFAGRKSPAAWSCICGGRSSRSRPRSGAGRGTARSGGRRRPQRRDADCCTTRLRRGVRLRAEGVRPVRSLPDHRQGQDEVPAAGRLAGLRRDVTPAYITWDQFVRNQQILRDNWFRHGVAGAPRRGRALLQGIVRCGRCGRHDERVHLLDQGEAGPGLRVRGGVHRRRRDVPDDEFGAGRCGGDRVCSCRP